MTPVQYSRVFDSMLVEDPVDEIQVRFDRAVRLLALFAGRRELAGVVLGLATGGMLAPAEAARRKRKSKKRCLQDERRCGKQSGKKGGARAGRRTVAAPPSAPA